MKKYFSTQLKRLWRIVPILLIVLVLLFGSIYFVYQEMVSQWSRSDSFQKMNIGVVGTVDDPILEMGINALQTMDSSNMSLVFMQMDEAAARSGLESGNLSAYIVFPESFMDNALMGIIEPLQFVSTPGSQNILSLVKDELTSALADILFASEYGAFGLADALESYGYDEGFQYEHINKLAIEYVGYVLERDQVYRVEELGISSGLKFDEYLLCGLSVVFLFLMTLPFVCVFVKSDSSLECLLRSRGVGAFSQVICELSAYVICIYVISLAFLPLIDAVNINGFLHMVPVAFCICTISYFIYQLTNDLISGVLLQMLVSVSLCFISGCFYPVYFFPISIQKMAMFLPAAMLREHLAVLLLDGDKSAFSLSLFGIGVCFMLFSAILRYIRIRGGKENKR